MTGFGRATHEGGGVGLDVEARSVNHRHLDVRIRLPRAFADQEARLKAALANATGQQVNLKVVVDPSVIGGIVATVGDTVIDGTVRTRLDQLKSRL